MPALMSNNDLIGKTLKKSFGKEKNELLNEQITLSSKLILNQKVEYVSALSSQHTQLSKQLKSKYTVLGKSITPGHSSLNNMTQEEASAGLPEGSLPSPKVMLHKWADVELGWKRNVPVGAGMINMGNTCYLNSTLQALFHVPSFTNWILNEKKHKARCNQKTPDGAPQCTLCAVEMTLRVTHDKTGSAIKPSYIYRRLNAICKHLVHGRQEDAHEFMRYLMESMDKAYLTSMNAMKLDARSKETSPINQIFGGYLRQEVKCLKCHYVSVTHQHFQDICLDIARVSSLDEALALFFRKETLDGTNLYKCDRCKQKVPATKQCFLERPPHVLCIQLKRFSGFGGKLNKPIHYNQNVNLTRFLHESQRTKLPITYKFTSLVNHLGSSQNCGHYTAVAMASNGNCYLFDDCSVRSVSINAAQNSGAYILMFERSQPPADISAAYPVCIGASVKPTGSVKSSPKMIIMPRPSPVIKPVMIGVDGSVKQTVQISLKNGSLPLNKEREKITFTLNQKQDTTEPNKPRLVINPKFKTIISPTVLSNGSSKVLIVKKAETVAKPAVTEVLAKPEPKSLVPYDSDSDEDRAKDKGTKVEVRATENKWEVTPESSDTSSVAGSSSTSDWVISEGEGKNRWENVKRKFADLKGKIFKRAKSEERSSVQSENKGSKFSSDTESLSSPVIKKVRKEKLKTCEEVEESPRKQNEKNAEFDDLKKFQKEHNSKLKQSAIKTESKEEGPADSLKYDVCPKKDRNKVVSPFKEPEKRGDANPAPVPPKVKSPVPVDDIVSQLKDMSHLGFGNQVSSWAGSKSKVDVEGESLRLESRKRTVDDLYNEELDLGREQKFKNKSRNSWAGESNGNQNPFQSFQDVKRRKNENGYSANNSYSNDWDTSRNSKWNDNRNWNEKSRFKNGGGFHKRKSWNQTSGDRDGGYRNDKNHWNTNSKYRR